MENYHRLTIGEREVIMTSLSQGQTLRAISSLTGRNVSTISREVCFYRSDLESYSAQVAHSDALDFRSIPRRRSKIDANPNLLKFIKQKLRLQWSPEQISRELKREYPKDQTMNVSHETIYTYLYLLPKGELRKELIGYLRQEKKLRTSRKDQNEKRGKIQT